MSLNESTVEDAVLTWFGELGYAVGHGPQLAPGEPAAELNSFGEVVRARRLREVAGGWRNSRRTISRNSRPTACHKPAQGKRGTSAALGKKRHNAQALKGRHTERPRNGVAPSGL